MKIISAIQEYSNLSFDVYLVPTEPVSGFSLYFGTTGVSGGFTTGIGFYGTGGMIFDNSGDLFGGYYSGRPIEIQGHLFNNRLSYFYDGTLIKNNLPSANNFDSIEFDKHGNTGLDLALNYILKNDSDALAYISLIESLGATVTETQKIYINTFVVGAKATGYYTSLKRLYFPIWGIAAANAIDMIGLTSGTFNGGVTHAAGYVQGNGTTGYFTTGVASNTLITTASGMIGTLNYTAIPSFNMSTAGSGAPTGGTSARCGSASSGIVPQAIWLGVNIIRSAIGTEGIQLACRLAGTTIAGKRNTAGYTEDTNTAATTASMSADNLVFLASNTSAGFTSNRVGAGFVTDGIDNDTRQSFTLALKNLWEGCTGLTLP